MDGIISVTLVKNSIHSSKDLMPFEDYIPSSLKVESKGIAVIASSSLSGKTSILHYKIEYDLVNIEILNSSIVINGALRDMGRQFPDTLPRRVYYSSSLELHIPENSIYTEKFEVPYLLVLNSSSIVHYRFWKMTIKFKTSKFNDVKDFALYSSTEVGVINKISFKELFMDKRVDNQLWVYVFCITFTLGCVIAGLRMVVRRKSSDKRIEKALEIEYINNIEIMEI